MTVSPGQDRPRIGPLASSDWTERQREVLVPLLQGRTTNIYTTLVRNPEVAEAMTTLGRTLRNQNLPVRHRETLILRTACNTGSEYEFSQHRVVASAAGMGEGDLARILAGPDAPGWDPFEAALCRAADDVHNDGRIGDDAWSTLATGYDESQLIQVAVLLGYYHLVALVVDTLGVPLEEGSLGFALNENER